MYQLQSVNSQPRPAHLQPGGPANVELLYGAHQVSRARDGLQAADRQPQVPSLDPLQESPNTSSWSERFLVHLFSRRLATKTIKQCHTVTVNTVEYAGFVLSEIGRVRDQICTYDFEVNCVRQVEF